MSDEQRERMLIAEQIERAAEQAESKDVSTDTDRPSMEEGLKRDDSQEKVVLSFSFKAPSPDSQPDMKSDSTTQAAQSIGSGFKLNPLKAKIPAANPLKRPNVFKLAAKSSSSKVEDFDSTISSSKKRDAPVSAAERLIFEDQERKRRRTERDAERISR